MKTRSPFTLFFGCCLALVAALVLSACAGPQQPQNVESLTIGIWGGVWGDAYKAAAIDQFTEQTGINVEMVTNVEDSLALLTTEVEKEAPLYDMIWLTDGEFRIAVNSGLLAPVNYENIAYADDLYDAGKSEYGVSSEIGAWGIAHNRDLATVVPTSWSDLLKPEVASKLGFVEPDSSGGSLLNLSILAVAAGGTPTDAATLGIEAGKQLAQNGARFGNFGEITTLFANGEIAYATLYHQEPIYYANDGLPAEFVMPSEGAYPVTAWMSMPRNLPEARKAVVEQFMSFVVSPEAQQSIAAAIFSAPINRTTTLDAELANVVHPYGAEEMNAMVKPDWEYTIENLEGWIDLWNREVQP